MAARSVSQCMCMVFLLFLIVICVVTVKVLTHLLNLYGHFPFGCGAAQLTSVVEEYHDSPSLDHLTELSSEVFDSPRVQVSMCVRVRTRIFVVS